MELGPGLNVFCGRNAQGKTSLLEAVGLVARGPLVPHRRRAEPDPPRGGSRSSRRAEAGEDERDRRARGRAAAGPAGLPGRRPRRPARASTTAASRSSSTRRERLRVVRGSMRDRRQYLDRSAAALWPAYRRSSREFERVLAQRNAALEGRGARRGGVDGAASSTCGARLRQPPGRLRGAAHRRARGRASGRPARRYEVRVAAGARERGGGAPGAGGGARRRCGRASGRPAAASPGPHRDARRAPRRRAGRRRRAPRPGQARSLLLALALATPARLPRGDRAAPRWPSSTTSTRSSTRSGRAPSARRSRGGGRPW